MEAYKSDEYVKCSWDGDGATWPDFTRRVRLLFERTPRKRRHLLAPSIVAQLSSRAWTITQDIDHRRLVRRDGTLYLLTFLKERLGRTPIPDIGHRLECLMIRARRQPGQAMSTWASHIRHQYRLLQQALVRVRDDPPAGTLTAPRSSSSPSTPSARRGSQQTEEEPHAEEVTAPERDEETATIGPDENDDEELGRDPSTPSARRPRKRKDSESDNSEKALEDVKLWDQEEEHLPDVLPSELLGWLLLRRAQLPNAARLAIQAAAGNSLKFEAVEKAMRSMEEELVGNEAMKGHGKGDSRRRTFWVEEEGHWSLLMTDEADMGDILETSHLMYVGQRLPPEVYPDNSPPPADAWMSEGITEWWEDESSPSYSEPWSTSWAAWEGLESLTPEEQREVDEAFAVAEGKARTFLQARQAVRARNLSRGFYPFSPQHKGSKGKGKPKGKGKFHRPSSSMASSSAAPTFLHDEMPQDPHSPMAMAAVGQPNYSGCFICGDKNHDFRHCPRRTQGKGSKGGTKTGHVTYLQGMSNVFMVQDLRGPEDEAEEHEAILLQTKEVENEMAGYGVIDSGATETVGSLPALEALMGARVKAGGCNEVKVVDTPPKRFKFGNGEHGYSASYLLIPQNVGDVKIHLGIYTLDVVGVPVLIGIRTLRRLKTVIDFERCVAVFSAVDPFLGIPLRRSKAGHLLLNLTEDLLSQGFRLDNVPPAVLHTTEVEEAVGETPSSAYMVTKMVKSDAVRECESVPDQVAGECAHTVNENHASEAEAPSESADVLTASSPVPAVNAQEGDSMKSLSVLRTLASFHAAIVGNPHGFSVRRQLGAGEQEGSYQAETGPSFGPPQGGRAGPEGSEDLGSAMLGQPCGGQVLQGIADGIQSIRGLGGMCQLQASTEVHPPSRVSRDEEGLRTAWGGHEGGVGHSPERHGGVPCEQGHFPPGRRELCTSPARTCSTPPPRNPEGQEQDASQGEGLPQGGHRGTRAGGDHPRGRGVSFVPTYHSDRGRVDGTRPRGDHGENSGEEDSEESHRDLRGVRISGKDEPLECVTGYVKLLEPEKVKDMVSELIKKKGLRARGAGESTL